MAKAAYLTPMLHVASVERSLHFYSLLGFTTVDTDRCEPIGWARMHCEGGAVMFLRAEQPFEVRVLPVLFYLYCPDLPALREHLISNGLDVEPIGYPGYMPSGEISLADPDGYPIAIGHWGASEHEAWLKRIGAQE